MPLDTTQVSKDAAEKQSLFQQAVKEMPKLETLVQCLAETVEKGLAEESLLRKLSNIHEAGISVQLRDRLKDREVAQKYSTIKSDITFSSFDVELGKVTPEVLYTTLFYELLKQEDLAFTSLLDESSNLVLFNEFTPTVLQNLKLKSNTIDPTDLIVSSLNWEEVLANKNFSGLYEPTKIHNNLLKGILGKLSDLTVHSDIFRQPKYQSLNGNIYLYTKSCELGVHSTISKFSSQLEMLLPGVFKVTLSEQIFSILLSANSVVRGINTKVQ